MQWLIKIRQNKQLKNILYIAILQTLIVFTGNLNRECKENASKTKQLNHNNSTLAKDNNQGQRLQIPCKVSMQRLNNPYSKIWSKYQMQTIKSKFKDIFRAL